MTAGGVRDEPEASRYVLAVDGETAVAAYERAGGGEVLVFTHTLVPAAIAGRGVATTLIAGALADVRARGLRIVPACSFVAAYLDRHPDDRDLVAAPA